VIEGESEGEEEVGAREMGVRRTECSGESV